MRNACKKAVWSGAALLCSLLVLSSSGQSEVYSVNVVGFQKLAARSNGLTMVATPFSKQSNTLDGVVGPQLTPGKTSGSADLISVWDPVAQGYLEYWLKTNYIWYTSAGLPASNSSLTSAQGFFVTSRRATNQTVVVSGDVPDVDAYTNTLRPGYNMVSYPFSTEIDINKSALTNGKTGKTSGSADLLSIWNSSSQQYAEYWLKTNRIWHTSGGVPASNVTVGAGKAFWYQNRNSVNFNWIEPRPYTF